MDEIFIGVDIGTQGVRIACLNACGQVKSSAEAIFDGSTGQAPQGWHQQNPLDWWKYVVLCLKRSLEDINSEEIVSISVSSTSGTVCFLDKNYCPLLPAIMYNDKRSEKQATKLNEVLKGLTEKMGYRFNSSYGLAKILWVKENMPQIFEKTVRIVHAADFITGKLTGNFCVSDYTNVLKTGYDLVDGKWPDEIENTLGISKTILPEAVASGSVIGVVSVNCSNETGLLSGVPVVSGMTDGCASQVSTGAVFPGEWNSTLGTTLVIKGVTEKILKDPLGRIYNHRHPDGWWLPGGASNTGGECIVKRFEKAKWKYLENKAENIAPTNKICWPLVGKGERFPFVNPDARGFEPEDCDEEILYIAYLEGVGYIEKLAYQTLQGLGAEVKEIIRIAGGGTKSNIWNRIRACILEKTLALPANTNAAAGAAILAASRTYFKNLNQACENMVKIIQYYEPEKAWTNAYQDLYQKFLQELKKRNYI
ncbi:MAG: FGGY family carbohydrate kinase [Candidatus Omnitrophica bacterium]|nr:FGGY family carbohydrate kinase [Candidatus Omnitrophota bacterium]